MPTGNPRTSEQEMHGWMIHGVFRKKEREGEGEIDRIVGGESMHVGLVSVQEREGEEDRGD